MSPTRLLGIAFAVCACAASVARAEDAAKPNLEATLVNTEGGGAYFAVTGKSMPLPDGTRLEVRLLAKGPTKDVVCALFRVQINDNRYSGDTKWEGQSLAALVYEAEVVLSLPDQSERVRRWCMDQYGFPAGHKEVIETRELPIGTVEERAAFARTNLETLKRFVDSLQGLRGELAAAMQEPAAEQEDWRATVKELNGRVVSFRREFDGYSRKFVILLERGFIQRLLSALKLLGGALVLHHRGDEQAVKDVAQAEGDLTILAEQIEQLLPITGGQPLVHPDAPREREELEGETRQEDE